MKHFLTALFLALHFVIQAQAFHRTNAHDSVLLVMDAISRLMDQDLEPQKSLKSAPSTTGLFNLLLPENSLSKILLSDSVFLSFARANQVNLIADSLKRFDRFETYSFKAFEITNLKMEVPGSTAWLDIRMYITRKRQENPVLHLEPIQEKIEMEYYQAHSSNKCNLLFMDFGWRMELMPFSGSVV